MRTPFRTPGVSIVEFEQVKADWVSDVYITNFAVPRLTWNDRRAASVAHQMLITAFILFWPNLPGLS